MERDHITERRHRLFVSRCPPHRNRGVRHRGASPPPSTHPRAPPPHRLPARAPAAPRAIWAARNHSAMTYHRRDEMRMPTVWFPVLRGRRQVPPVAVRYSATIAAEFLRAAAASPGARSRRSSPPPPARRRLTTRTTTPTICSSISPRSTSYSSSVGCRRTATPSYEQRTLIKVLSERMTWMLPTVHASPRSPSTRAVPRRSSTTWSATTVTTSSSDGTGIDRAARRPSQRRHDVPDARPARRSPSLRQAAVAAPARRPSPSRRPRFNLAMLPWMERAARTTHQTFEVWYIADDIELQRLVFDGMVEQDRPIRRRVGDLLGPLRRGEAMQILLGSPHLGADLRRRHERLERRWRHRGYRVPIGGVPDDREAVGSRCDPHRDALRHRQGHRRDRPPAPRRGAQRHLRDDRRDARRRPTHCSPGRSPPSSRASCSTAPTCRWVRSPTSARCSSTTSSTTSLRARQDRSIDER